MPHRDPKFRIVFELLSDMQIESLAIADGQLVVYAYLT